MLSNWEEQAVEFLESEQYEQLVQWCDQAIGNNEQGSLPYWYLGLAYLLQQQAEEAQAVWLSGWFEAPGEETSDQRTEQLATILEREAQRQAGKEAFSTSAEIRENLQEIQPENINNTLKLTTTLINNQTFEPDLLKEWDFLPRLEATPAQNIDDTLLRTVLHLLLTESFSIDRASLVNIAFTKIEDQIKFLELLVGSALKLAYSYFRQDLAVEVMELCEQLEPNFRLNLKYLTQVSSDASNYKKAIETGQKLIQNSQTLPEKVEANCLFLRALLSAGNWREVPNIMPEYRERLKELADYPIENISAEEAADMLPLAPFYLNYIEDQPQENRLLQNATSNILQFASKKKEINRYIPSNLNRSYLKIAYIGHSLRYHSVGWLARWLIQNHHRDNFHITVYTVDSQPDNLTKKLADNVDHFRLLNRSTWENAQRIADDEIDILIDVDSCTFTKNCQLLSYKPAPIQVTWLGWDASGLPAIDYYIADHYVLPENAQEYYQETIWRLPHSYVAVKGFEVDVPTLTRTELEIPSDATVYFTAQNAVKRNPDTVRLQMQILKGVPNSYLLIKGLSDQDLIQNFFNEIAEAEGVNPNRLRFLSRDPNEYIHRANLRIADVVLDTYPYNGATTTLETLWMGIPLVTKVGQQFAARNSYTFLKNAGVEEGIAWTDEEYVKWGIRLGTEENLRRDVHWKLLESRKTSPLWDVEQFVNDMETAYQQMWEKYVEAVSTEAVSYPVADESAESESDTVKNKPTVRLLHNLPRCGGTIISKCLATMNNHLLLSEIHPRGMEQFNPLQQAHEWFNLLSTKDLNQFALPGQIVSFMDAIHLIQQRSQEQDYNLIIRDWAHLDFFGVPWTNNLSYRLDTAETLAPDFHLIQCAIVRHPIDQWLALTRWSTLYGKLKLETFLKGYLEFAKLASEIGFIRYEDFTYEPDTVLQQLCQQLDLTFDPNYKDKWQDYNKITGDPLQNINNQEEGEIKPQPRRPIEPELLETIENNKFYQEAIKILGYESYKSSHFSQNQSRQTLTLNLHIGGKEVHSDWKIVDIESRPEVDYVTNASDLSMFESASVDRIYSSHTLEHFYYGINNELLNTLNEWNRVLKPGGKVLISVPDLETLSRLYIRDDINQRQRFQIMRMMFGGQTNIYDVHKVGFDFETLKMYLEQANLKYITRVKEFNLFNDCSSLKFLDTLISLNVIAYKSET